MLSQPAWAIVSIAFAIASILILSNTVCKMLASIG